MLAASAWYFLVENRPATVATNAPATVAPAHLSIVVLPFANLSGDPAQDYFADGITENLTTDLSRIRNSFVIARNTAFTFKGKNVDAKEIGKELGVRYVLEGSVQRDQNHVRVPLTRSSSTPRPAGICGPSASTNPCADLFSLQDEIVASLASQLGAELITKRRDARNGRPIPTRWISIFREWRGSTRAGMSNTCRQARGFFERALALDPGNLDALLGTAAADVRRP